MSKPATPKSRQRAHESRKVAAGGRRMPGGVMPPEAAVALAALEAGQYAGSASACIHRALIEAAQASSIVYRAGPPNA